MENLNQDTGFGDKASEMGGRMVNRDGSYNIQRLGISFRDRVSSYHSMLTMPRRDASCAPETPRPAGDQACVRREPRAGDAAARR